MKRKILPFALILGSLGVVYACSSSNNAGTSGGTPPNPEGGSNPEGSVNPETGPGDMDTGVTPDGSVPPTTDPIQGTAAPKQVADALGYADGPQWWQDTLYVSRPLEGFVEKVDLSNGSVTEVSARTGEHIVGLSVDKNNFLLSAGKQVGPVATAPSVITRMAPDGGALTILATSFKYPDGGSVLFDNANDLVQHPGGAIFVTDPGYDTNAVTNHLVTIYADGGAFLAEDFADDARPNGIGLTKDGSTLYITVTSPVLGTKPYVKKYTVSAGGTLTNGTKFAELPHPTVDPSGAGATNDEPDGLAVDDNGNVYVAWRLGVNVYKSDGTRYGAEPSIPITAPNQATNLTFGRADRKSLFITTYNRTDTTKGLVYEAVLNVPGILQ